MIRIRPLALTVGISLISIGLLGPLTFDAALRQPAGTARDVLAAPYGSEVVVEGLLEAVRPIGSGAALSTLSDCSGARARVYFPEHPASLRGWGLVRLRGTVQEFGGQRELAVDSVLPASPAALPSVAAHELVRNATTYLCRSVAMIGHVESWERSADEANGIELKVPAAPSVVTVALHFERRVLPRVDPEANITFVGVPAFEGLAEELVLHVRA